MIFEKFHRIGDELRRTTAGTGLGLYIVRRLVEQSGATVRAESGGANGGADGGHKTLSERSAPGRRTREAHRKRSAPRRRDTKAPIARYRGR